ncbi:MAG: BREX-6 system BrxE protein, partial [Alkalinema sp. CAN_BIN05]|nr:BREX-6 system BrxE protein [Alkalinema sp. CAN_BIN05]
MISTMVLDSLLSLQLLVAWSGEGLSEPKRLNWWRTDLVDEGGGGDFLLRLLPKTHQWAALSAVRQAAIQVDRQMRLESSNP